MDAPGCWPQAQLLRELPLERILASAAAGLEAAPSLKPWVPAFHSLYLLRSVPATLPRQLRMAQPRPTSALAAGCTSPVAPALTACTPHAGASTPHLPASPQPLLLVLLRRQQPAQRRPMHESPHLPLLPQLRQAVPPLCTTCPGNVSGGRGGLGTGGFLPLMRGSSSATMASAVPVSGEAILTCCASWPGGPRGAGLPLAAPTGRAA